MSEKKEKGLGEWKKAEKELRSSEERFRVLFEYAPDGIYLMDLRGNFIDGNKAAEELVGYRRGELIGKNMAKVGVLPKSQIPKALANLTKNAMGRPTGPDYFTLIRKDGNRVEVEIRTYPVNIKDKTLVLGIARDITERKKADEEIRENEEKFRTIFESANDIIMYVDRFGKIIDINKKVEDILGYKREDVVGKNFAKTGALTVGNLPKIVNLFLKSVRKGAVLGGGPTNIMELELRHKNGKIVPLELSMQVIKKNGKVEGFLNILRDITERKKVEEKVKNAERDWRNTFNSLEDVMLIIDKDYNIENINESGLALLGKSREQVIGKKCYEIFHGEKCPTVSCPFKKTLETKKPSSVERYEKLFGGYFSIKCSPMFDENGKIVRFVDLIRDVTERKKAEEMLKKSKKELEAKIDDLERFNKASVGRELKMIELKKRVKKLEDLLRKYGIELEEDK